MGGARVILGPYSADSDTNGVYVFKYVPRGDYELRLDSNALPADYAWDGRRRTLAITSSSISCSAAALVLMWLGAEPLMRSRVPSG